MWDFGHVYPTYTPEMCDKMAELCTYADIVTPNITEACILTGTAYKTSEWDYSEIKEIAFYFGIVIIIKSAIFYFHLLTPRNKI